MTLKIITIISLIYLLGGCSVHPVKIPEYNGEIKVYASNKHMSSLTEVGASVSLVDNSQVYLGGNDKNLASYLGLVGAALDVTANDRELENEGESLSVSFDELLRELIPIEMNSGSYRSIQSEKIADIIFLPSVRLLVDEDDKAEATFRITVRFVNPVSKDRETKYYLFTTVDKYSISGENSWAAKNAFLLKESAKLVFSKLLQVVSHDISGIYNSYNKGESKDFVNFNLHGHTIWKMAVLERFDSYVLTTTQQGELADFQLFWINPSNSVENIN